MKKVNIGEVLDKLNKEIENYDVPVIDLIKVQTNDPFKILIATILSARTKDETTAKVSEKLFEKIKTFDDIKKLSLEEIENLLYPVGFYKTKAKHIQKLPGIIKSEFNGKIPDDIDDLVKLPGVGRKTANLVMSLGFNKPGICVDVHVHRITNRLGFIKTKTPLETEIALRKKVDKKYWILINRIFVAYGQSLCTPISPHCSKCKIYDLCNRVGVKSSR